MDRKHRKKRKDGEKVEKPPEKGTLRFPLESLQEKTGFAEKVLGQAQEDIWNDV